MASLCDLQVVLTTAPKPALAAGLPAAVRGAHSAAGSLCPRLVVVDGALARRYRRQLENAALAQEPEGGGPVLVLSGEGFPSESALPAFLKKAREIGKPVVWVSDGAPAAAYLPDAGEFPGAQAALTMAAERLDLPGWTWTRDEAEAAAAEQALCASLRKDTDGYIARFDRTFSIALSRLMLRAPITPNAVTTASLALGLLGAWWLACGHYFQQLAGAALLWFCCLLDGCDGEIARLKLLSSPGGAAYDVAADHLAHLATFLAIPVGVYRAHPETSYLWPGTLLVTGFIGSMTSVWWLVLRRPEENRGPAALFIERVASRDYVYLILALTAIGRLEWFLWAAAFGSHAFYLALWWLFAKPARPLPTA